jgi:hypothetical protein
VRSHDLSKPLDKPATLETPLTAERSACFQGFYHYWHGYLCSQAKPWDEGWPICLIISAREGKEVISLRLSGLGFDSKE